MRQQFPKQVDFLEVDNRFFLVGIIGCIVKNQVAVAEYLLEGYARSDVPEIGGPDEKCRGPYGVTVGLDANRDFIKWQMLL